MILDQLRSLYDFTDRTVLITGGAGVLGLAMARTLVACNANVVILSRDQERAAQSIAEIARHIKSNGCLVYVPGDVLEIETLNRANQVIQSQFGAVDILINATGGNHPSGTTTPELSFFDLPQKTHQQNKEKKLLGTILPCQVFGRGMARLC